MNTLQTIEELERNKAVFENLLSELPEELITFKSGQDNWCLLEIICHLYDEEREDFRNRVKFCLETPDLPLQPIDPVGWVQQRKYSEQDFVKKLGDFLREREKSLKWLKSLSKPNWQSFIIHPNLGKISAIRFLQNWLVHDFIHIRQILKVKYAYLENSTAEDLTYAGNW